MSSTRKSRPMIQPAQFDPQQAADYLGISRSLVYELMRDRELPFIKIGRSTRITRKACDRFIMQMELEQRRRQGAERTCVA